MEYFQLRNGVQVSCIGMGSFPMKWYQLLRTVPFAHQLGITLIDTAHDYNNELLIGMLNKIGGRDLVRLSTKMSVGQQRSGGGVLSLLFRKVCISFT